jgi:hypothetical protein
MVYACDTLSAIRPRCVWESDTVHGSRMGVGDELALPMPDAPSARPCAVRRGHPAGLRTRDLLPILAVRRGHPACATRGTLESL